MLLQLKFCIIFIFKIILCILLRKIIFIMPKLPKAKIGMTFNFGYI